MILLVATRSGGEIAVRLGQPPLVGELLAGVVLGVLAGQIPDLAPRIDDFATSGAFRGVLDLVVFFLLLLAGIEIRPEEIAKASMSAFVVAVGGMVVPLVVGFGLGWIYLPDSSAKITQAAFLGIVLAITAVPVAIKMLIDLGQLHTRVGQIIVSAAVFDDVLGLALLAALTAMIGTGVPPTADALLILGAKVVLFVATVMALGIFLVPRVGRGLRRLRTPESELGVLLIAAPACFSVARPWTARLTSGSGPRFPALPLDFLRRYFSPRSVFAWNRTCSFTSLLSHCLSLWRRLPVRSSAPGIAHTGAAWAAPRPWLSASV